MIVHSTKEFLADLVYFGKRKDTEVSKPHRPRLLMNPLSSLNHSYSRLNN